MCESTLTQNLLSSGVLTVRSVLKGPIPTEVDAAMEQEYVVKGSKVFTVMDVCELGTVLWMVCSLLSSVILRV